MLYGMLLNGILGILAGIIILAFPGALRFIVGGYLILAGILNVILSIY